MSQINLKRISKIPKIHQITEAQAQLIQSQIFLSDYYTAIKEVFENSVDANSRNIKVYISTLNEIEIKISDDGCGIENLEAIGFDCSSKLETSKVQSNISEILSSANETTELSKSNKESNKESKKSKKTLQTLGFRGRALASLALQSDLKITTKTEHSPTASSYDFTHGLSKKTTREVGTTVEIKNLFKTCKIRKQKGINISRVIELIKPYLLVFDIHTTIYFNGQVKFAGAGIQNNPDLKIEDKLFEIKFFEKSEFLKNFFDKKSSFLFAGKHPIEDKKLLEVLKRQYLFFHSNFPFVVCILKGEYKMFGILKNQIKLSEEFLKEFEMKINEKLKVEILNVEASTLLDFNFNKKADDIPEFLKINDSFSEKSFKKNSVLKEVVNETSIDLSSQIFDDEILREFEVENLKSNIFSPLKNELSFNSEEHNFKILNSTRRINISKYSFSSMKIIGQFNSGFILVSYLNLLIIIDQHAADEIFNYELIVEKFSSKRNVLFTPLKLPDNLIFDLTDNKLTLLRNYGFIIKKNLLIEVPYFKDVNFGVEEVSEILNTGSCLKIHDLCASNACRSSIMIGDKLNLQKMKKIVNNLSTLREPWKCPHGRPVFLILKETK